MNLILLVFFVVLEVKDGRACCAHETFCDYLASVGKSQAFWVFSTRELDHERVDLFAV